MTTEEAVMDQNTALDEAVESRVYEVGYHVLPTVKEDEVDAVVNEIRSFIEKAGGSLIAEGAPAGMKLAYTMYVNLGGKQQPYDRSYFGWMKFEVSPEGAVAVAEMLEKNPQILRSLVFKTVREDTRASARPTLREVKRGDTITARRTEETVEERGEVSEEALDKSIEELTAE